MHRDQNKFSPVTFVNKAGFGEFWALSSTASHSPLQGHRALCTPGKTNPAVVLAWAHSWFGAGLWLDGHWGRDAAYKSHPKGDGPLCPQGKSQPWFWIFCFFFFLLEGFAVKLKFEEEKEKKVTRFYIVKVEINHFWEDRKKILLICFLNTNVCKFFYIWNDPFGSPTSQKLTHLTMI